MIVTMGIFSVVTAFVTANFRGGSRSDELRIASQFVAGEIRRAQTMTISGRSTNICVAGVKKGMHCPSGNNNQCGHDDGLCLRSLPPGGYGVQFSTDEQGSHTMQLFADIDGNGLLGGGEEIRTVSVSPDVYVRTDEVAPNDNGKLSIVFRPPNASPWFNGQTDEVSAYVRLALPNADNQKYVRINAISGQISAD